MIGTLNKKYIGKYRNIYNIPNINNPKELAKWYCKAYVFFNPTKGETFGLTNYEAQACGTPTVTYDAGGTKETILLNNSYVVSNLDDFLFLINNKKMCSIYNEDIRDKIDYKIGIIKQIDKYAI